MAYEKLQNKTATSDKTGAYFWIIKQVAGVWTDFRISVSDLLNELTVNTQYVMQKTQYAAQTVSFTHAVDAESKIWSFDFKLVSGSCTVAVGTTPAGTEVIDTFTLTDEINYSLGQSFPTATTLYITITGTASISMNVWYNANIF